MRLVYWGRCGRVIALWLGLDSIIMNVKMVDYLYIQMKRNSGESYGLLPGPKGSEVLAYRILPNLPYIVVILSGRIIFSILASANDVDSAWQAWHCWQHGAAAAGQKVRLGTYL